MDDPVAAPNPSPDAEAALLFEQVRSAYHKGDYAAALAGIDHLLPACPDDLDVRYARALALEGLGRASEAIEECEVILARSEDPEAAALRERLQNAPVPAIRPVALVPAAASAVTAVALPHVEEIPGGQERGLTPEWTIFAIFITAPIAYAATAALWPGLMSGVEVVFLRFLAAYARALVLLPVAVLVTYAGLTFLSMRHGRAAVDLRNAAFSCGAATALAGIPYAGIPLGLLAAGGIIARVYHVSIREVLDVAGIAFFVLMIGGLILFLLTIAGTVFFEGLVHFL